MKKLLVFVVGALVCGVCTASFAATIVELDAVVVTNGAPILVDDFDNGMLDSPPWIPIGSPGPESGTILSMGPGDMIIAPLSVDPAFDVSASVILGLSDFPAGSSASLLLLGPDDDVLNLIVLKTPTAIALYHGIIPLGFIPFTASAVALTLTSGADGTVSADVNGSNFFIGPVDFGPVTGVAVLVLPEPATLALVGIGVAILGVRRPRGRLRRQ